MGNHSSYLILLLTLAVLGCSMGKKPTLKTTNLRCEYLVDPLGIGETQPRLSWILESPERSQAQSAYRILVSGSRELLDKDQGDLWDSGKVIGANSAQILYGGKVLGSRQECFWKVCAWDKNDRQTEFSKPAFWSMGLLNKADWQAKWIGMESEKVSPPSIKDSLPPGPPPAWLRKEFSASKPVAKAVIYATARGIFELYVNGSRVGQDLFTPGWTDYDKRIQYLAYDITPQVLSGNNALGAVLADGWYSGYLAWYEKRAIYSPENSLLLQLELTYADGTKETVATDESWRCAEGPILSADFLMGESYDARREMPGWDSPGFADSSWKPALVREAPEAALVAVQDQPVRLTERIEPVALFSPVESVYVFDLGQNIAGWARLKVSGEAGTKITIRYAERLNPDSTLYTTNLRKARATDTYILKGGGEETWEPRFTFHGFQYIELTGFPGTPGKETVTGCAVHSDTPPAGFFQCSNPLVNQLWSNITWSQRGNFISIPTDCPQRDERLGWMGDAQVFIRTATCCADVAAFFNKWMYDVEDGQSSEGAYSEISPRFPAMTEHYGAAGWADAGIIIPWTVYLVYGDTRIIEKHYQSMSRWMDWVLQANPNMLRLNERGSDYGDWLSIAADTPKEILATAYWAYDARLMSKMAAAIGRPEDARKYMEQFQGIREAFRKAYVSADGHVLGDTQTGYLLALYMDLLPENLIQPATELLVANIIEHGWHLTTGFLGVRHLNPVLTRLGHADIAYRLLNTDTFPSWLYPIKNGATTIWERWDGWTAEKGFQDPGMNSFNHYSLGSVGEWLYRYVAGIDLDPEEPGFGSIIIHPYPGGGLDFARAEYMSIRGLIRSAWTVSGNDFDLEITIPANTRARVFVPSAENSPVTEGSLEASQVEGIGVLEREAGCAVFSVGSGDYHFKSKLAG